MSEVAETDSMDTAPRMFRSRLFVRSIFLCLLGMLTILPGCGGCGGCSSATPKTPEQLAEEAKKQREEEAKKKKEEKKLDFTFGRPTLQPGTRGLPSISIKPGHWASATQSAKANNFDFLGEMDAAIVDPQGDPINLYRTPFRISTTRPAALVKGQEKYLDMTFFVPHNMRRARLSNSLRGTYAGSNVNREESMFQALLPYQYFMLVVARTPERYGYLNKRPYSIYVPWSDSRRASLDPIQQYLVISTTSLKKPLLIPSDVFTWTSTAYMFWDDVEPDALTPEQQQAVIDWIHWGGQLIISGPSSLATLKGSFLAPYLPATQQDTREFTTVDLQPLNDVWTLPTKKGKPGYPLRAAKPWSGVQLVPHADAQFVPHTGEMLVERRVGQGRIVVSAMTLTQPELTQWASFDGFFNACVLRRDPRKWEEGEGTPRLAWANGDPRPDDPKRTTGVRYFSRDAGSKLDYHVLPDGKEPPIQDWSQHPFGMTPPPLPQSQQSPEDLLEIEEEIESTKDPLAMGGVASWNSFSPTTDAARETLRRAAGVDIPEALFVLKVVGLYILVIVPINWLMFKSIGRLEWAWVAAPILAVVFSVLVIRLAQLDIGFVRAQTEVAVLELQPGYNRGHLTRYLAIYTSLGTQYDMHFESPAAVAQPMPLDAEFYQHTGQDFSTVNYRRFDEVTLNDVTVSSNSTGMLQGEQMVEAGQSITIVSNSDISWTLKNGSPYDLEEVSVLRNRGVPVSSGLVASTEFTWVGTLKAGESKTILFQKSIADHNPTEERKLRNPAGNKDPLKLDALYQIAEHGDSLAPGETRLVGKLNGVLPGVRVTPEASQLRGATMVVAHLHYEPLPAPVPDTNTQADIDQPLEEIQIPLGELNAPLIPPPTKPMP